MGANIPLPALSLQQHEAPNVLQQLGQIQSLRGQQQQQQIQGVQLQQQQQQLKDQQAMTAAMQNWDGKDGQDLIKGAIGKGASATAIVGLQSHILQQKEMYSKIAADDATTGAKNLDTYKGKSDAIAGAVNGLKSLPDDQLGPAIQQKVQELQQSGILSPQEAQKAAAVGQMQDPKQMRDALDSIAKLHTFQSQQMEKALKDAQEKEALSRSHEADVNANKTEQEMKMGGTGAMADSRYRFVQQKMAQKQPVSPDDAAFVNAYEKQKTLNPVATFNLQNGGLGAQGGKPSALAQGVASGQMKWNDVISPRTPMSVKEQFAAEVRAIKPDFNSGDFAVEQKVKQSFTSGTYSQQLNAINTARQHMQTFKDMANALDNGSSQALNSVKNAWNTQFGSDAPTNFTIAKDAFSGEIGKALAGAGVTQGDRNKVEEAIKASESPKQLLGAANTADALLAGKQTALKSTFNQGMKAQPNFGEQGAGAGMVRFKDSTGQLHDIPAANLEKAKQRDPGLQVQQ